MRLDHITPKRVGFGLATITPSFDGPAPAGAVNAFPGGHRPLEPPDPIPNSDVKRWLADASVGPPHANVGYRQGPLPNTPVFAKGRGCCFARTKCITPRRDPSPHDAQGRARCRAEQARQRPITRKGMGQDGCGLRRSPDPLAPMNLLQEPTNSECLCIEQIDKIFLL